MRKIPAKLLTVLLLIATMLCSLAIMSNADDLDYIYYSADDATIWAKSSGAYSATRSYDSNMGYYLHYINPGSGANCDPDRLTVNYAGFKVADYPVMKIGYRTENATRGGEINLWFGNSRMWGGNLGSYTGDGNWQTKTADLSALNWIGGDGSPSIKKWADVGANKLTGFLIRPFNIKGASNYFDISYVAFFKTTEDANAFSEDTRVRHTVNFENYDGSVFRALKIIDGRNIIIPTEVPTEEGYEFIGWDIEEEYIITEPITVKPIFKKICTVKFMTDETTLFEEMTFLEGDSLEIPSTAPAANSKIFTGWNGAVEGSVITGDTTYYADWINVFLVKFYDNGEYITKRSVMEGNVIGELPEISEIDGFNFIGWFDEFGEQITENTIVECDLNVYARFDEIQLPVVGSITVSDSVAYCAKQIKVDVTIESNPGIAFMRLFLDYDSDILTLVGVEDHELLGHSLHTDDLNTLPYVLFWNNPTIKENITENGTAVTLVFDVAEDAPIGEETVISLSYDNADDDIMDTDFAAVDFDLTDGIITIKDPLYGDVNDDGKVTAIDGAYIARYLANWAGYGADTIDHVMADVNLNGEVDAMDSVIISRHLARWTGYLTLPLEIEA